MAYRSASINNGLLRSGFTPTLAYPFTVAAWVAEPTISNAVIRLDSTGGGGSAGRCYLYASPTAVQAEASRSGYALNTLTIGDRGRRWFHVGGTFAQTATTAWADGVRGTTDTTNVGSVAIDVINCGYDATRLAEFAVWNAILAAGEMKLLAAGVRPSAVRPESLVGYWPLAAGWLVGLDRNPFRRDRYTLTPLSSPGTPAAHPNHLLRPGPADLLRRRRSLLMSAGGSAAARRSLTLLGC